MLKKLTSRKLLAAIAGIITGIAIIFGVDSGTISTIAGAVTTISSVVAYIYAEGKIDAASVSKVAESVETIVETLEGCEPDEVTEMEDDDEYSN